MRSQQWRDGRRNGITWAITQLHEIAREMNDPHAASVLNTAALTIGTSAKRDQERAGDARPPLDLKVSEEGG